MVANKFYNSIHASSSTKHSCQLHFSFFSGVPLPLNRDNIYTVEKMVCYWTFLYSHKSAVYISDYN